MVAQIAGAALLFLAFHFLNTEVWKGYLQVKHLPCPPGRLPFLGHALTLLRGNVWETFRMHAQNFGWGIYRMHVLGRVFIPVASPEGCKQIMMSKMKNYVKDKATYGVFSCLLGTGIVTSEGERWTVLRRQLAPTFKLEILGQVSHAAFDVTYRLFPIFDEAARTGKAVDISEYFRTITLQVIGKAVLGIPPEECDRELANLYLPIIDECNDRIWYPHRIYLPSPAWFRHQALVKQLNSYLEGKIRNRWSAKFSKGKDAKFEPQDILDRILAEIEPEEFNNTVVTELRDGLKTFLFAGHDTTSCMLTWTWWEMMNATEVMDEVKQEADELFGNGDGRQLKFDELRQALPFSFNVLRESLRVHSPVPVVTRVALEADEIDGVRIPAGAVTLLCLDAICRRKDLWPGDDADIFRPHRFGIAPTTSPQTGLGDGVDSWSFLPFINGPRNCLGQHFSLLEARIILALLVQRYSFSPAPGQTGIPHAYKIPITPVDGMYCQITKR